MNTLARKNLVGSLQLIIGLGLMLFVPAWTMDFWQAWVYLVIFGISISMINGYLFKKDPKLLERRMNRTEKLKSQKLIQLYLFIAYISIFVCSSLDHRFLWSDVPLSIVILGDSLAAFGFLIVFLVLKENTFAASTIEVAPDHQVISTGVYAIIRHPMYFGGMVMLLGTPLGLGSWWALLSLVPITMVIGWRILDEEKLLSLGLPGYREYCQKVTYRLVPFIW